MRTTETSSLDETFYRHFYAQDEAERASAEKQLDDHLGQLASDGVSRYEITRQMISGIVGAQERREAELEAERNFATTNGQPRAADTQSAAPRRRRNGSAITTIFWITIFLVIAAFALPKVW